MDKLVYFEIRVWLGESLDILSLTECDSNQPAHLLKIVYMYVVKVLGPAVKSIVSLTASLRRQLVKDMLTTLSKSLLFFVEKM